MKLDQCHKQQCERGQKTKPPGHLYHNFELARGVRFQNLERHHNDKKRYTRLNALQGSVAEEDCGECRRCENEFQSCRAKPVSFWLHPKFHCERDQKKAWDPGRERAEHWRQSEEQCGRQPKQRSPWNTPIPLCAPFTLTLAHAHALQAALTEID